MIVLLHLINFVRIMPLLKIYIYCLVKYLKINQQLQKNTPDFNKPGGQILSRNIMRLCYSKEVMPDLLDDSP